MPYHWLHLATSLTNREGTHRRRCDGRAARPQKKNEQTETVRPIRFAYGSFLNERPPTVQSVQPRALAQPRRYVGNIATIHTLTTEVNVAIPMTANDIISLTAVGRLYSQTTMTVLHYRLTSVGSLPLFNGWASSLLTYLNTPTIGLTAFYTRCLSEDWTAGQWWIQKIHSTRLVKIAGNMSPTVGGVGEAALPPGVAASITKRAAVAGRNAVGGIRLPAIPVTSNEAGYMSTAQELLMADLCLQLQAPLTTVSIGTLTPIIYNRTNPTSSLEVVNCTVETTLRTMKRRVVGRGI